MAAAVPAHNDDPIVVWQPQPGPQTALIACPVFEIVYGGARGGGKTDGMLGEWLQHANEHGAAANGVFFRRELIQLDEAIERSHEIYGPLGAVYRDQKKTWNFPNGARLKFRPLERDSDAEKYQGHSYTRVYFEELTNFPDPKPVDKLKATLRSATGVPVGFRATCNPGGPGHQWVKARYITPAPHGYTPLSDSDSGLVRIFIPARLRDNRLLMDSDPMYVERLKQSGSEELVRAWLEGDWDVVEGAYFDCWRTEKHVIAPFEVPDHWTRIRSLDWGSARPFSVGWYAVSDGGELPDGRIYPAGAMIKFREWYGASAPNVGLKMTAEEVADGIVEREKDDPVVNVGGTQKVHDAVADPSIGNQDGGPSIQERMARRGVRWRKADNARVPKHGHIGGWDQMRARLVGEDDKPMLYFFKTCVDSIRTIPALQHDPNRPEDVDTHMEDHAGDETRYAVMARPWMRELPKDKGPIVGAAGLTMDKLWGDADKFNGSTRMR